MISSNPYIRSPLFYVGDKYKLLPQLIPNYPKKYKRFIEVFVGGGSVFLNSNHKSVSVNDVDRHLIEIHKKLISYQGNFSLLFKNLKGIIENYSLSDTSSGSEVSKELKKKYPKTYFAHLNKNGYNSLKSDFNKQRKKNYLYLYILLIYGFNRMLRFNKSGEFNLPVGNVDFNTNVVKSLQGYLDITSRMNIDLYALDFREFLKIINPVKEDFVYLDPPYLITGSEYNKIWNRDLESELYELVDQLDSKGVNFMLSNVVEYNEKTNDLLLKWSKKYRVIEIESNYINFNDNGRKKIREILVVNYA